MIMIFNGSRYLTSNKYQLAVDPKSDHLLLQYSLCPFYSVPFNLCPQYNIPPCASYFPPSPPFSLLFTVNLVGSRRGAANNSSLKLSSPLTFHLCLFSKLVPALFLSFRPNLNLNVVLCVNVSKSSCFQCPIPQSSPLSVFCLRWMEWKLFFSC